MRTRAHASVHACSHADVHVTSPASDQFEETLNSLKYANRAKNIRTKEVTVTVTRPTPASEQLAMVRELRDSFGTLAGHDALRGGGGPPHTSFERSRYTNVVMGKRMLYTMNVTTANTAGVRCSSSKHS